MEHGGTRERLRRVDARIWDALLAAVVLALGLVGFFVFPGGRTQPAGLGAALVVAASVPIAWRRRAPLAVTMTVAAAAAAFSFLEYQPAALPPLMIASYTAASLRDGPRLWATIVPAGVIAVIAMNAADGSLARQGFNWVELAAEAALTAGVPITLGRLTFHRRRRIARDRELAAREAVAAERARIARELHDVVAHHMSVMVVQAGAARAVTSKDPDAAADALRQIEVSGRAGLTEMRRLLGMLKSNAADDPFEPQPGLDRLGELVKGMRATGLAVEAVVEGTARRLPPGVDLSAYRIVQEALTNSLKHAPGAHARVLLRYEPRALEIEIADDGPGAPPDADGLGGQGLIGMRERALLFGGTVESGPRPGGGFAVRARLPLAEDGEPV